MRNVFLCHGCLLRFYLCSPYWHDVPCQHSLLWLNAILVRLTSCRCPDLYAHPSWWHVSCASVLAFSTYMSYSWFPAFLRLIGRRRLALVWCWLTSDPASTTLFPYPFSELCYFKATYFYHAKVAWCCEGLLPSCVAAIAVTNKIVRNLPFCLLASSSLQGIVKALPLLLLRSSVLPYRQRQKEYCERFSWCFPHGATSLLCNACKN